ncbi:epimerase [Cnuibacter sp. UC19_7]|uniref:epimerase n=1 Tax=Cnuibacter sp. UC19_7 TaxID=3350166 RepID=UPI00366E4473
MTDRVVLAGASGFIGQALRRSFESRGATVITIGRSGADARWGDTAAIRRAVDGAQLVVNLAGKSVNCRYDAANRREIFRSRLGTTREVADAIAGCELPPPVWLNASTATIYRHAEDRPMTESTGEIGEGFSVNVATSWEEAFFERDLPGTRRVALRMAIVLGDGSALRPILALARWGLGGPQLDGRWPATTARLAAGTYHRFRARGGRQRFSWVHLDDVVAIVHFLRDHPEIDGLVNVVAPGATDNRTLMRTVRRAVGRPFGLPAFRWMLELGTAVLRTETELVLKSRWVAPERLEQAGYSFLYRDHGPAIRAIVAASKR